MIMLATSHIKRQRSTKGWGGKNMHTLIFSIVDAFLGWWEATVSFPGIFGTLEAILE
jgi:hypothetical protein